MKMILMLFSIFAIELMLTEVSTAQVIERGRIRGDSIVERTESGLQPTTQNEDVILLLGGGLPKYKNAEVKAVLETAILSGTSGDQIHVFGGHNHSPVETITIPDAQGKRRFRDRDTVSKFGRISRYLDSNHQNIPGGNVGQIGLHRLPQTYWSISDGTRPCRIVLVGDLVFDERRHPFWSFQGGKFPSDASVIDNHSTCPFFNRVKPIPSDVDITLSPISNDWGNGKVHRDKITRFYRLAIQQQLGGRLNRISDAVDVALDDKPADVFRDQVIADTDPFVGMWILKRGVHQILKPDSLRDQNSYDTSVNSVESESPPNGVEDEGQAQQPGANSQSSATLSEPRSHEQSELTDVVAEDDRAVNDWEEAGIGADPEERAATVDIGSVTRPAVFSEVVDDSPIDRPPELSRPQQEANPSAGPNSIEEIVEKLNRSSSTNSGVALEGDDLPTDPPKDEANSTSDLNAKVEALQKQLKQQAEEFETFRREQLEDSSSSGSDVGAEIGTEKGQAEQEDHQNGNTGPSDEDVANFKRTFAQIHPDIIAGARTLLEGDPNCAVVVHRSRTRCAHADIHFVVEHQGDFLDEKTGPKAYGEVILTRRITDPPGRKGEREEQTLVVIRNRTEGKVTLWSNVVFSHHLVRTSFIALTSNKFATSIYDQPKQLDSTRSKTLQAAWVKNDLDALLNDAFSYPSN